MLTSHTMHHMAHCTMTDMVTTIQITDSHTPVVHATPYIPPALHIGVVFSTTGLMLDILRKRVLTSERLLHNYLAPPHTPPPR
jgi:hypothetical protein